MITMTTPTTKCRSKSSNCSSESNLLSSAHCRTSSTVRQRYSSITNIWSLPSSLLEHLFSYLHIKDLLNVLQTNSSLYHLLCDSPLVWRHVKFTDTWPEKNNLNYYLKALEAENFETVVKLGIAYLYNEGLQADNDGSQMTMNGTMAAKLFTLADSLSKSSLPFSWLLYRSPWSVVNCCKSVIYTQLKTVIQMGDGAHVPPHMLTSVARVALLEGDLFTARSFLELAATKHKSSHGVYMLYQLHQTFFRNMPSKMNLKPLSSLTLIRQLRSAVQSDSRHIDASFTLLNLYMRGEYGELDRRYVSNYTVKFLAKSTPFYTNRVFTSQSSVTTSMRYILVDWLVEVATVKGFTTHTLHQSIYLMDRYLKLNKTIQRSTLQLLGIACLVICSRFTSDIVVTIWEACWLTDNTYRYQDMVKMIASVIVSCRGHIRAVSVLDYLVALCYLTRCGCKARCLAEYISELCLQHPQLTIYKQSHLAASCVILAKLMLKSGTVWGHREVEFTGIHLSDLKPSLLHIHEKCFVEESPKDHRYMKLDSVKERFFTDTYSNVSSLPSISRDSLLVGIGTVPNNNEWVYQGANLRLRSQPYLIMSPSRSQSKRGESQPSSHVMVRASAGTPPPRPSARDVSTNSGYEADVEFGEDCPDSDGDGDNFDDSMDIAHLTFNEANNEGSDSTVDESFKSSANAYSADELQVPVPPTALRSAQHNVCRKPISETNLSSDRSKCLLQPTNMKHTSASSNVMLRSSASRHTTPVTDYQNCTALQPANQTKRTISTALSSGTSDVTARNCRAKFY